MSTRAAVVYGRRGAIAAVKLALAGYFAYLVLLWPGLPWYAYPAVAMIVFSTYRIVTRQQADLRMWWVYLAGALLFARLWFLADETGAAVRFDYVIDAERWLFGGQAPTVWLQDRWYSGERGPLEWALVFVYTTYFFVPHLVAVLVWRDSPLAFRHYATSYVALLFAALIVFAVAPTAPPWMAALEGHLPAVSRIILETASGFSPTFYEPGYEVALGNAVAAMPSVHTGATMLILLAAWRTGRQAVRVGAAAYLLAMGLALVYLGEHYVLDLAAGVAVATAAWHGTGAWWRWRDRVAEGSAPAPLTAGGDARG